MKQSEHANLHKKLHVIVCGTDPTTSRGGIGVVMPGYLVALRSQFLSYEMLPTYRPNGISGKWLPWVRSVARLPSTILSRKMRGEKVVVYSHAGALPSMFRESVVGLVSRIFGAKFVMHSHTPEMIRYLSSGLYRPLVKIMLTPADTVCALTPWWGEQLKTVSKKARVRVVPNPLPPNLALQTKAKGAEQKTRGELNVLAMARLVAGKGVDIAITALQFAPQNVILTIAGDGAEKKALESLSRKLGVNNRVQFVGWITGAEKEKLLRNTDVFCLPSTYDVFPMAIVEASSFGKPVIATSWAGIPDLVIHNRTGVLTTPSSPEEVGAAIARLTDPALREQLGESARQHIAKICSSQNVGRKLANIFIETFDERP